MSKKVLFISAFPPNNKTAGQNYSFNLIENLSENNKVDVVYWNYDKHSVCSVSNTNIRFLKHYDINSHFNTIIWSILCGIFPFFTIRFNISALKYIRDISHKYDVLYFDFSQVFIYSIFVTHPYKVMMCHDVISQKFSRYKLACLYNWWVKCSENRVLKKGKEILCFSEKDKLLISDLCNVSPFVVSFYIDKNIQNIDLDSISLKPHYCFYGAWNRSENSDGLLWFVDNVLPFCKSNITFKVIGGGMPIKIQQAIKSHGNMDYVGFVDNPYLMLAESIALIAPLFKGAGVKVKVIETLAVGTPVIGTNIAFEGIDNIKYAGTKSAQKCIASAKEMIEIINHFDISIEEKKEIKNSFLSTYSKNKFVNMIDAIDD